MNTYLLSVETFDTPATQLPNGQWAMNNYRIVETPIKGWKNACAALLAEKSKGPLGRVAILRGPLPSMKGVR